MISLYNFKDFREYILARLAAMPKEGYGQSLKLAKFLGVHSTLVSQVLRGSKTFTLEQGAATAEFLGLSEDESEFFVSLLELERAGNEALKRSIRRRIARLEVAARELSNRLSSDATLTDEKKAVFYSDWIYSAVRQMAAIQGFDTTEKIAQHFLLSSRRAREVVDFLLSTGLLVESEGKLRVGQKSTHLGAASPWVQVHHTNWRNRAIQNFSKEDPAKLHYTCPMTLSAADAQKVREGIVKLLESVDKIIEPSPSEELRCLTIDWFKV